MFALSVGLFTLANRHGVEIRNLWISDMWLIGWHNGRVGNSGAAATNCSLFTNTLRRKKGELMDIKQRFQHAANTRIGLSPALEWQRDLYIEGARFGHNIGLADGFFTAKQMMRSSFNLADNLGDIEDDINSLSIGNMPDEAQVSGAISLITKYRKAFDYISWLAQHEFTQDAKQIMQLANRELERKLNWIEFESLEN